MKIEGWGCKKNVLALSLKQHSKNYLFLEVRWVYERWSGPTQSFYQDRDRKSDFAVPYQQLLRNGWLISMGYLGTNVAYLFEKSKLTKMISINAESDLELYNETHNNILNLNPDLNQYYVTIHGKWP
jgi:hypothetical protein